MSRKLDNSKWEEYINKFNSYRGEITLKDFCIENQLSKTQFYYHKKRLEKANSKSTVFHEVSLKDEKDNIAKFSDDSTEYFFITMKRYISTCNLNWFRYIMNYTN